MKSTVGLITGFCAGAGAALLLLGIGFGMGVQAASAGDPYSLPACPVSGAELSEGAVTKVFDGREVKFCCAGCPAKFEADQAAYFAKIDEAMTEDQKPVYPLDTCLVSGEALDSMGGPVSMVYNNRLVMFCCNMCKNGFQEDAAEKIAELDQAVIEAQEADYPLKECPVAGTDLGGGAYQFVIANRLIETCCGNCASKVKANPAMYLAKLEAAE